MFNVCLFCFNMNFYFVLILGFFRFIVKKKKKSVVFIQSQKIAPCLVSKSTKNKFMKGHFS